jgi:hypothetical protein
MWQDFINVPVRGDQGSTSRWLDKRSTARMECEQEDQSGQPLLAPVSPPDNAAAL